MLLDKIELNKLYSSGLSMSDISKKYGVSLHKISYWMNKYNIHRRSRSNASYLKHNPLGDPFKIEKFNTKEKQDLLAIGIALYMAEGSKKNQHGVRFTNSDTKIIQLFLVFLKKVCGAQQKSLRAWVNLFDDISYTESLDFWIEHTGILRNQFYKPTIRPQKQGSYKNKSKYGTITVLVDNKKLRDQIDSWIQNFFTKYAEVAQW